MKSKRWIAALLTLTLCLALLAVGAGAASAGWRRSGGGWWYQDEDGGYPAGTWRKLDGAWFYFGDDGYLRTGWLSQNGAWYYLRPSGVMAVGWQHVGGSWYYFDASGAMVTGWREIDGVRYHFRPSGRMTARGWAADDGAWYYMDADGEAVRDRWVSYGGGWYYCGEDGRMVTGSRILGAYRYVFDDTGMMTEEVRLDTLQEAVANTAAAEKTDQLVLVVDHNLTLWDRSGSGVWEKTMDVYCGYGRNGLAASRREGDGTTPIGAFPLTLAFGLGEDPGAAMPYRQITASSYWSDETATYNTWVESGTPISGEHLADYYQYKYAIAIGYNIDPPVPGLGSAIFLHCKSTDHWYTGGCVSVTEENMLALMRTLRAGAYILIVPDEASIADW